MEGFYKINVIPSDLSVEETILQISDSLDNLNGIVDDVFARIMRRINQNVVKTDRIKERIEVSRNKVDSLKGMQKAIKVFSSVKYPPSIKHEHYESVFGLDGYRHTPTKITLSGRPQGLSPDRKIQDKLHFYHVKVAESKDNKQKPHFNLKDVIDNTSTIGELLIYDTDESPYLGTVSRLPAYVPKINTDPQTKSLLEDAPSSILKRDVLKREADEYMYAPGMGMVPELDMPLDLPHLPGIAGDVQFTIATAGSIAPSVVTSPVAPAVDLPEGPLPELPDLKELTEVTLPQDVPLPDVPDVPPPAPPAPMLPPPPPPPPPPPMEAAIPTPHKIERKAAAPVVVDARANLMEAIRQAGGAGRAKLRSAATDSTPAKGTKPSGGDLMADLHAKLSMRRRGISGAERGSVLHTLASVIPEPGEQSSPQQSSSDDDWK